MSDNERITALEKKIFRYEVSFGVVVALAAFFGIKGYSDINTLEKELIPLRKQKDKIAFQYDSIGGKKEIEFALKLDSAIESRDKFEFVIETKELIGDKGSTQPYPVTVPENAVLIATAYASADLRKSSSELTYLQAILKDNDTQLAIDRSWISGGKEDDDLLSTTSIVLGPGNYNLSAVGRGNNLNNESVKLNYVVIK